MHKPESVLENETHKILWDFEIPMNPPIPANKPGLVIINKAKEPSIPVDHRVKINENEKRDKYLDLTKELKKLSNMKVTVMPIIIGVLETVPKGLESGLAELEIEGQIETTQTTTLLKLARIPRRALET